MTSSIERRRPAEDGPGRQMLSEMLDFLRATAETKLAGLSLADASRTAVSPSALTAIGIVKHLTGVERFWFSIDFAGHELTYPWPDDDPHGGFPVAPTDTVEAVLAEYREECARSRTAIDGSSLNDFSRGQGMTFTLRYALLHLIEETARHCGHLDLIREVLDGSTGE